MRSLRKWARGFSGYFPSRDELLADSKYWNWKIPTAWSLLEGKYTNHEIQRECAQLLIDACAAMIAAKPAWAASYRTTCLICRPDMWSSEICIYLEEDYFLSKIKEVSDEYGFQAPIENRSLASDWLLSLPDRVKEWGVLLRYDASPNSEDHYVSEHWLFGEVESTANKSFNPDALMRAG
jgi:hypothetical protein